MSISFRFVHPILALGLAGLSASAQSWEAHLVAGTPSSNLNLVGGIAIGGTTTVALGQPRSNPNGLPGIQDSVRVFELQAGAWSEVAALTSAQPLPSVASYGSALAIQDDLLAVGDPFGDTGLVHLYRRGAGGWALEQVLVPSDPSAQFFGTALDLEDDLLVVGAPTSSINTLEEGAVYLFRETPSGFVETQRLDNPASGLIGLFGMDVDLSTSRLLVGTPGGFPGGAAYLFEDSGSGSFALLNEFLPTTPMALGRFGEAVALDGARVAIGAPGFCQTVNGCFGRVTVFDDLPGGWTETAVLEKPTVNGFDRFGADLAFETGSLFVASQGSASGLRYDLMPSGWVLTESYITSAGFIWPPVLPLRLHSASGLVAVTDLAGATVFTREVPAELEVGCPGNPHPLSNTGFPVLLDVKGELALSEPTLPMLVVHDANLGPGLLFYGFGPASLPFGGTTLCVQGPVARAEAGDASTNGQALQIELDLQSKPVVGSSKAILPGADAHFQYWFRVPGGGTHLSSSLRMVFVP